MRTRSQPLPLPQPLQTLTAKGSTAVDAGVMDALAALRGNLDAEGRVITDFSAWFTSQLLTPLQHARCNSTCYPYMVGFWSLPHCTRAGSLHKASRQAGDVAAARALQFHLLPLHGELLAGFKRSCMDMLKGLPAKHTCSNPSAVTSLVAVSCEWGWQLFESSDGGLCSLQPDVIGISDMLAAEPGL